MEPVIELVSIRYDSKPVVDYCDPAVLANPPPSVLSPDAFSLKDSFPFWKIANIRDKSGCDRIWGVDLKCLGFCLRGKPHIEGKFIAHQLNLEPSPIVL